MHVHSVVCCTAQPVTLYTVLRSFLPAGAFLICLTVAPPQLTSCLSLSAFTPPAHSHNPSSSTLYPTCAMTYASHHPLQPSPSIISPPFLPLPTFYLHHPSFYLASLHPPTPTQPNPAPAPHSLILTDPELSSAISSEELLPASGRLVYFMFSVVQCFCHSIPACVILCPSTPPPVSSYVPQRELRTETANSFREGHNGSPSRGAIESQAQTGATKAGSGCSTKD